MVPSNGRSRPTFPLKGLLTGMKVTFKAMLKKPVTVNYPVEKETPSPGLEAS